MYRTIHRYVLKGESFMKVGEFKKLLETVNDDIEIICTSDNFELNYNCVSASAYLQKFKKKTEGFIDAFDHQYYTAEVYKFDKDGDDVVVIIG
jgi:hypothetical protein